MMSWLSAQKQFRDYAVALLHKFGCVVPFVSASAAPLLFLSHKHWGCMRLVKTAQQGLGLRFIVHKMATVVISVDSDFTAIVGT